MSKMLDKYLKENKVDVIYCEDTIVSINNTQTVKILSALQGAVLATCEINDIEINFVSVSWKNIAGINITHSSEFKQKCKLNKDNKIIDKFKKNVKSYEKKMSVDLVNKLFDIDLIWKSATSEKNQDDISDSMLIVCSKIFPNKKYDLDSFDNIIEFIWNKTLEKSLKKGD